MIYTIENISEIPKGSYGVIGNPVEHSMSPALHSLFAADKNYVKIYLKNEELQKAIPLLSGILAGFNITIPFKQDIIPFLDKISDTAKLLGSVNTVKIENGKLIGFNTDLYGFLTSVEASGINFKNKTVLMLGAGGVAKTMGYAVVQLGGRLHITSRTFEKTETLANSLFELTGAEVIPLKSADDIKADIILNATPSGMWKKTGFSPFLPAAGTEFIYDSIYNPVHTKLLLLAEQKNNKTMNGSLMLSAQAAKAREIWDGIPVTEEIVFKGAELINKETKKMYPVNIVLTGFMGSGKSTIGKKLSKLTGLPLYDLDSIIETNENKKISEIFKAGEDVFRQLESRYLEKFLKENTGILSLGGGTVCFNNNIELLKSYPAFVFYLQTDLEVVMERVGKSKNRPLMKKSRQEIEELFLNREKYYLSAADFLVNGNRTPGTVTAEIYNLIKENV